MQTHADKQHCLSTPEYTTPTCLPRYQQPPFYQQPPPYQPPPLGSRAQILEKISNSLRQMPLEPGLGSTKMLVTVSALRRSWRLIYTLCVPVAVLPVAVCIGGKAGWCAYIMLWMASYWSAEVVPLAVTSLMPVFLFPFFGIVPSQTVTTFYMNEIGIVGVCSLIMAGAVERSNLHKRIALKSLIAIGTSNFRLLLGVMVITMVLSMWIPNTAAASIMAPIVMAIVDQMYTSTKSQLKDVERSELEPLNKQADTPAREDSQVVGKSEQCTDECRSESSQKVIRTTMLLSVAYAANIGGTGSIFGTGPNMVLKGLMDELFPESTELTFATWMMYNVPTMVICVLLAYAYLLVTARRVLSSSDASSEGKIREEISRRYQDLGPISFAELCVAFLMTSMILLWFTMKPQMFPGWVEFLPYGKIIKPSAPAMIAIFLLFVIPKDPRRPTGRSLITWDEASDSAQWGVILLIGGGSCLAEGCKQSGLSAFLVEHLKSLDVLPHAMIALVLCFAASMLTEVMSNTAISSILLPVVCNMAIAMGVHPLYLAMPVTIGCSFSFMLPAASPPNAIVYELAELSIPEMARPGFVMNMVCVIIEVAMIHVLGFPIFGLGRLPEWAQQPGSAPFSAPPMSNATGAALNGTTIMLGMNYTTTV
ncbi:Na(+)/citrate cotransporter-like isoform X2 [Haemaphysalis longicornis]